jgi:hypothetical protein
VIDPNPGDERDAPSARASDVRSLGKTKRIDGSLLLVLQRNNSRRSEQETDTTDVTLFRCVRFPSVISVELCAVILVVPLRDVTRMRLFRTIVNLIRRIFIWQRSKTFKGN